MALTSTTLASACGATDKSIVVTSATGFAAGYKVKVDSEEMEVAKDYVSGTTINVLRGRGGSVQAAHPSGCQATAGTGTDWSDPAAGSFGTSYLSVRPTLVQSYSATGTMTLPPPGADLRVILNGTSVITLTIPVPTRELDGCELTVVSNGAAAHVPTFTGGVGGAGTSYDAFTFNATGKLALKAIAAGGTWQLLAAAGLSGTVTNITAGVA